VLTQRREAPLVRPGHRLRWLAPGFVMLGPLAVGGSLVNADRLAGAGHVTESRAIPGRYHYEPSRRVAASLEPVLRNLGPGADGFPEEKLAQEIAARLKVLSAMLREKRARDAVAQLLAPEFKGERLTAAKEVSVGNSAYLEVLRGASSGAPSPEARRSRDAFGDELLALIADLDTVTAAELIITAIDAKPEAGPLVHTTVRYDVVGTQPGTGRAQRVGRWDMAWRREADQAWRIVEWTARDQRRSRAAAPVFADVSETALGANPSFHGQLVQGLEEWVANLDGVFGAGGAGHHGVSVGDFDGDGLDDIYVSQPPGLPNRLFRNKGDGTFEDVTEAAGVGVLDGTSEALFVDVDNDGDEDLILVTRSGLLLFLNDGKGHFTVVPDAFRFQQPLRGSPTSVSMADYDKDGFLDLYLCTYGYFIGASEDKALTPTPYHDAQNGPPNVLLRNDGHGHFVDVTDEVGLNAHNDRFSFAAAWADYDEDGWPDLLVANDFGRKNLYHNEGLKNGKVTFKDVAAQAGVEDYGAGMSATWLDYDNDGHLDIYLGNMWSAAGQRVTVEPGFMPNDPAGIRDLYRRHARGNTLLRNRGDGTFEDVTLKAGAEFGRWAWSSDAIDFDNDGSEDLFVMNGMFTHEGTERADLDYDSFFWRQVVARSPLTSRPGTLYDDGWRAINRLLMADGEQAPHERKVLLRNDGHGGFDEVSGSVGLDLDQDGRSFAVFDFDHDGRPDVVVLAPRSSLPLHLFRNEFAERNAAIAVRLTGNGSNRDAVGARVTVETDHGRYTKILQAGSGFLSQHSKELLFGLGKSTRILRVEVRWPNGLVQDLADIPLNNRVSIREGDATVRTEAFRPRERVVAPVSAAARTTPSVGTWMYRPFPAPDFILRDLAGKDHSLSAFRGKPALVLFWAAGAPPSVAALQGLTEEATLSGLDTPVLAVAVDAPDEEAKVRAASQGLRVPVMMGTEDVAGTYSILSRYLFDRREDLRLPTLLLIDGRGEVAKVYRDHVDWKQVAADIPKIEATPAERLARAAPFRGTFYAPLGERNYFQYSLDLAEQGFDKAALAGFELASKLDPIAMTFYNLGTLYAKAGQSPKAQVAFERALSLKQDYAEANNSLGALLAQSGQVPTAIERFRAALRARPDFADALNNLGYALSQSGKDQEAYGLYQKALAAEPEFPEALNNLGIFFGQQGDLAQAESFFKRAVTARPAYGEATNNLAMVLGARGDGAGAIALLQRFLEQDPSFEPSYVTLAKVYLSAGRKREGIQVLELLLQKNPKNPAALGMLAQIKGGAR
jgi:tetratricopeptide (TPR) repeat protein